MINNLFQIMKNRLFSIVKITNVLARNGFAPDYFTEDISDNFLTAKEVIELCKEEFDILIKIDKLQTIKPNLDIYIVLEETDYGEIGISIEREKMSYKTTEQVKVYNIAYSEEDINRVYSSEDHDNIFHLIQNGIPIDYKDQDGNTALHLFSKTIFDSRNDIYRNDLDSYAKELIIHGADVNVRNNINETPLMFACEDREDKELIELLIEHKADVNAENKYGTTALMYACRTCSLDVVETLISNGANRYAKDKDGNTAEHYARKRSYEELIDYFDQLEVNKPSINNIFKKHHKGN